MENSPEQNDKRPSNGLHPIHDYFIYDVQADNSTCTIANCGHICPGRHANNLTKHISRNHKDVREEIELEISNYHNRRKKYRVSQCKSDFVTVKINKKEFKDGALELTTSNGRPYSIFRDSGMVKMIGPILAGIIDSGENISIERQALQRNGNVKCSNIKKQIKEEMAGKMFSICIDLGTTVDGRSVLGINTQYYSGLKLVQRCLAMKVNRKSSTAIRIAVMIWIVLKEYDLKIEHLIAVTSDNGANVLKCIKILRILQFHALDDYLDPDIEKIDFEMLERLVDIELQRSYESGFLHGIKCCAHTLNLCLDDGMKGE